MNACYHKLVVTGGCSFTDPSIFYKVNVNSEDLSYYCENTICIMGDMFLKGTYKRSDTLPRDLIATQ